MEADAPDLCRLAGVDFVLGLSTNPALRAHVAGLQASTAARQSGSGKVRRFAEFFDAARSWRRVERIIARIEAGPQGVDTRFIVTSLEAGRGTRLYEHLYCRRDEAENHIKAFKRHLAADCTSWPDHHARPPRGAASSRCRVLADYRYEPQPSGMAAMARWADMPALWER